METLSVVKFGDADDGVRWGVSVSGHAGRDREPRRPAQKQVEPSRGCALAWDAADPLPDAGAGRAQQQPGATSPT